MNPLEESFADAIKYTSQGMPQLYATQDKLVINSLNAHLISLEASFQKEKSISTLVDVATTLLSPKTPLISSKLLDNQKMLLVQIDRITFCLTKISKLNYLQKNDILDTLYNADMKQCIEKIIMYTKIAYKIENKNQKKLFFR
jgi:hypothetical protein